MGETSYGTNAQGAAAPHGRTRIAKFDNIKFVLIVLVVIGHAIAGMASVDSSQHATRALYQSIYLFHMPLFVFLSGMFAQSVYSSKDGLKTRRMIGYLIVYVFMLAYYWVIAFACGHGYVFGLFTTTGAPWYMMAMFIWSLLVPFVCRYRFRTVAAVCIALSVVAGFTPEFGGFLSLGKTVYFAVFFYAGYYCDREAAVRFLVRFERPRYKVIAALILIVSFVLCLSFPHAALVEWEVAQGGIAYSAISVSGEWNSLSAGMVRILSYGISVVLCVAVAIVVPSKESKMTILGRRTLQVYALHPIFTNLAYFTDLDGIMLSITPWWPALCIVLSIALAIALASKVFERPFNRIMGYRS